MRSVLRATLSVTSGLLALLALLAVMQPARSTSASLAAAPRTAATLDVVINEVAWSGTSATNTDHEWIELRNNTTATIDLTGWRLYGSGGATPPDVILSGTIPISGYFLLERVTDSAVSDISADQIYPNQTLNNSSGILTLTDSFSNVIDTANGNGGSWPGGTASSTYKTMERIDPLAADTDANWESNDGVTRNGLDANGAPLNGTPKQQNSVYIPPPPPAPPLTPPGSVLISALHFDAYSLGQGDEGFRLTNVSTQPITLTTWAAVKDPNSDAVNLTGTLQPQQSIWIAKTAVDFTQQFGFKPDYKYTADADSSVPLLTVNGAPAFGDSGKLVLRQGLTNTIDALIWGTTALTDAQWITSPLQRYGNNSINVGGQILYRKLDETTGRIVTDTNTAQDWANDRTDPISGRKTQYPGWDLEKFWQTAKVTGTATLTVAISPDNSYRVISDVLGSAQHSIVMEMYSFDNLGLLKVVTSTLKRGVSVTILLEGTIPGEFGGVQNDERWVCVQIEAAGGQCWFMSSTVSHARYAYVHAKLIIVDDRVVAIGSENLSPRSLTYDNPADGTRGHRGVYLVTDASGVVSRALEVWNADFDPVNQRDIVRWTAALTPTIGYVPVYTSELSGYRIRYPVPLTVTAPLTFELLTSPESSLRASDGVLGLIGRSGAGDTIDVEQLDEPPHWGDSTSNAIADPNLRLEALIAAAGRGVNVRLLLDRHFDDPTKAMSNAATVQSIEALRAISPTLHDNLEARLGDPAMYGIHNKMFLVDVGGQKFVHAGSLNGTETSNKANREVALQVESSAAYDYLRAMFEYDWAFQPRIYLPLVMNNYIAPPNRLLISKVFYLGSPSVITGSEWVQLYNPTPITVSLTGYKLGDQAAQGSTGFTVDGMWTFPLGASIAPSQVLNIATTGRGFFNKYGYPPQFAFFTSDVAVPLMSPYLQYTPNISFSLANAGDEVLLLGTTDQLVDGVAWGTGSLLGNVSCLAIDMSQYPEGTPNPSIKRDPLWKDTNNCPADFVIDPLAQP
jgi:phosphatidylserine/phosphatidylglycerophosphate/cardiolipin synthase-like enzyme